MLLVVQKAGDALTVVRDMATMAGGPQPVDRPEVHSLAQVCVAS